MMAQPNHPNGNPPPYTPHEASEADPAPRRRMSVAELARVLEEDAIQQRRNSIPVIEQKRQEVLSALYGVMVPGEPAPVMSPVTALYGVMMPGWPAPEPISATSPQQAAVIDWDDVLGTVTGLTWGLACDLFWHVVVMKECEREFWPYELDGWLETALSLLECPKQGDIPDLTNLMNAVYPSEPALESHVYQGGNHSLDTMRNLLRAAFYGSDPYAPQTLEVNVEDLLQVEDLVLDDKTDAADAPDDDPDAAGPADRAPWLNTSLSSASRA